MRNTQGRAIAAATFLAFIMLILILAPIASQGQTEGMTPPAAATKLAMRYLRSVNNTNSYDSPNGRDEDFFFIGTSVPPSHGWRVIVVRQGDKTAPRLIWDSFALLHDRYLDVLAPSSIDSDSDGPNGYIITLRGCVPHDCADGRIGFAIYASRTNETYISHVSTKWGSGTSDEVSGYEVTYFPKSGVPESYRDDMERMMCSDIGISLPSLLPFKCPKK